MTTRTLTLIRHAKSSWDEPALSDFDRPLNKRGLRDAPRVGAALQQAGVSFDKVLCSDAQRARQTLSLLQQELGIDPAVIEHRHDLYGASAGQILASVSEQIDTVFNIAVVAHNPGMENLANSLGSEQVGTMATCCAVHLIYESDNWDDLLRYRGKVDFILRPRDL